MRLASIDIGTNTTLLLVVQSGRPGEMTMLEDHAAITRLGEWVDRTQNLSEARMRKTLDQITIYGDVCRRLKAERVFVVCTSAVREADNGGEFVSRVERETGFGVRILTGEEEARLSFQGALDGIQGIEGDCLVADIGGGSTELIWGVGQRVVKSVSLPMGSVRLTERFARTDPIGPSDFEAMTNFADRMLSALTDWPSSVERLVGIAGTVTTLAAVSQGLDVYSHQQVHGSVMTKRQVEEIVSLLRASTVLERKRIPGIEPGRADVILAGAALLDRTMRFFGCSSVVASDRGVRYGVVKEELRRAWLERGTTAELVH